MLRLFVIGHAGTPTGYARVLAELLPRLSEGWDVTLFAFNARKPGMSPQLEGVEVIPNRVMGDIYGRDQLPKLLDRYVPDVILIHHDFLIYEVYEEALDAYRRRHPGAQVVVYCPIEWDPTPDVQLRTLAGADILVAYTHFGLRQLESALTGYCPRTNVIHHGVDAAKFHPLREDVGANRLEARSRLIPDRADLEDAFIVLNANRNVPRKRIDLTLRAFAEFARDKPDAYLYLHMGMQDSGIDVPSISRELGIEERLLCTTDAAALPDVSDDHLNLIYNACDIGINTSTGEGWGLVAFEHAATGAAQIVPDHTAGRENWEDRALLVPAPPDDTGARIVDVPAATGALGALYDDPQLRGVLSRKALDHARNPHFSWETVAENWKALLEEAHVVGTA